MSRMDHAGFSLIYFMVCEGPRVQIWKTVAVFFNNARHELFLAMSIMCSLRAPQRVRELCRGGLCILSIPTYDTRFFTKTKQVSQGSVPEGARFIYVNARHAIDFRHVKFVFAARTAMRLRVVSRQF